MIAVVVALLLVWVIGGYFVVVAPKYDKPSHVDAILVLGPADTDGRLDEAVALYQQGYADNVVVSATSPGIWRFCVQHASPDLTCFAPDPSTTQGEAREIGRLSSEHGWKSIIVITSKYHISRARMIVKRCMNGNVLMVPARDDPSIAEDIYQYFYQTGAYLKAFLKRGC